MIGTRTTTTKGHYRPQKEAMVQVASVGMDFGHLLSVCGSREGSESGASLIFMRLGKGRRNGQNG